MRALVALPAEPAQVLEALRSALAGDGPAVLPLADGASVEGLPTEVPQRTAAVVQTSGSAGTPKRVALSRDAMLASVAATEAALGGPGTWVLALPVHYIAGLQVLARSIAADREPVVLDAGSFDVREFADAVLGIPEQERAYSALVPAQLASLLESGDERVVAALRRIDAILIGGQRLPDASREAAASRGARIVRTYGSTETCGGCVYDGEPVGGTLVRIVEGEVWLATPALAEEYLGDPERTAAAFVVDDGARWYRTGDAGRLDDGMLRVTGRLDDVLVSGGEKVSLGLVEAVVRDHPGFAEAVVVRAPHPRWGETPVVVVAGGPDSRSLDDLRALVGDRLGPAARPDRVHAVDAIPLLPSGKPDRVAITRLFAAE